MGLDITRAFPAKTDGLAHLIAEAFHDLPQTEWLVPDPVDRREIMPRYFTLQIEQAMGGGAVYVSGDRKAAAVWNFITPGVNRQLPQYDARLADATGEYATRFRGFEKILDEHAPHDVVHHHLWLLAVAPENQNCGYGSALLDRYYRFLDSPDQIPAYLEAATPRSARLYRRHGYQPMDPIALPDGGPVMQPMWRRPTPRPPGEAGTGA